MAFKHERVPRGYDRDDYPLPHRFNYQFSLGCLDQTANKIMTTFLRTSTLSIGNPNVIVNPKNAAFAIDTGPLINEDSIVNRVKIRTSIVALEGMIETDKIQALACYYWNIHGAFEDSWTPADKLTTTTTAQLLHVTSTTAQQDVVPENGAAGITGGNQPLSTVTGTEVFGTYDLTTNAVLENQHTDAGMLDEIYDAKSFYSNGGKMNSLMGHINRQILTKNKPIYTMFEDRLTPKQCRHGNPHMFFARQHYVPALGEIAQVVPTGIPVTGNLHLGFMVQCQFNEWNKDFNQKVE